MFVFRIPSAVMIKCLLWTISNLWLKLQWPKKCAAKVTEFFPPSLKTSRSAGQEFFEGYFRTRLAYQHLIVAKNSILAVSVCVVQHTDSALSFPAILLIFIWAVCLHFDVTLFHYLWSMSYCFYEMSVIKGWSWALVHMQLAA